MRFKHVMSEDNFQCTLVRWAQLQRFKDKTIGDYLIHVPNGGKRTPREAFRFKRMGVKSGVSDLFLCIPNKNYHGLWMELKVGKNKLTKSQLKWLENVSAMGYYGTVCYLLDEAQHVIKKYLESA